MSNEELLKLIEELKSRIADLEEQVDELQDTVDYDHALVIELAMKARLI